MVVNTVLVKSIKLFLQSVDGNEARYDVAGDFFDAYEITSPTARADVLRAVRAHFSVDGWSVHGIDPSEPDIILGGIDQITFVRTACLC